MTPEQRDFVVEVCHDLTNKVLRAKQCIGIEFDDFGFQADMQLYRAQEEALRAALSEIDRLTALTAETAKFIDNFRPFLANALPTHKERGGEADRQKIIKWADKLRAKLAT